jgi:hypothetical protein
MTVKEAISLYDIKETTASDGDNLRKLAWRIYTNTDYRLIRVLSLLNNRRDGFDIQPGDIIKYFNYNDALSISEL